MGSMLCSSGLLILLRNIRETHFTLFLLFEGAIGVLQSFFLALIVGVFKIPSTGVETLLLGTLATLTFLGQICIIAALKFGSAGGISVVRCLEIAFGFLWQFQFLEVYLDIYR
jgi:drug/metabolite transporter (DMT)-like permease